jgi:hypothetical protein
MMYVNSQRLEVIADSHVLHVRLAVISDAAGVYFQWMLDDLPYACAGSRGLKQYRSEANARRGMEAFIDRNARVLRRA